MRNRAVAYVTYGQLGLAFFLAVCVALHPGLVLKANEGGMSNYGIHLKTTFAYTLALGLPALMSYWAAPLFDQDGMSTRRFSLFLRLYSLVALLTLLSTYPYSLDVVLRDLHIVFGSALIIFETVGGVWLSRLRPYVGRDRLLVIALLAGFILATVTIAGALHVLFLSQVLTSGAFAILLVRTAKSLAVDSHSS